MIEHGPFNQHAGADHGWLKNKQPLSFSTCWDAKHAGGAVMASLAIALRGLLVTTAAVGTVAYLLLTNSHL